MENTKTQLRTETLVPSGSWSLHKKDDITTDNGSFIIFLVIWMALFLFFQSPSKNNEKRNWNQNNRYPANSEEKKLQEKVKSLEYSIRTISLKKREVENEIRKIEMDNLLDDKANPFDTELKLDKLKMRLEELSMNEEKKMDDYDEATRILNEYLSPNQ